MGNNTKHYTEAFVKETLEKIRTKVINEQEMVAIHRKVTAEIDKNYREFRLRFCGGIIQPEWRFVEHTMYAMRTLGLENTDLNLFAAAAAMAAYMVKLYGPGGYAGLPDMSNYQSAASIADLMNKINEKVTSRFGGE